MTGSIASGLEAAGSNEGGAMLGFAGMTMGMNVAGGMGAMPGQRVRIGSRHKTPSRCADTACILLDLYLRKQDG